MHVSDTDQNPYFKLLSLIPEHNGHSLFCNTKSTTDQNHQLPVVPRGDETVYPFILDYETKITITFQLTISNTI